jgi:hypothetical protein
MCPPTSTTIPTTTTTTMSISGLLQTATILTAVVESTTLVAVPETQPSDDNIALIGGIVGGIVALILIVGVIAFIVARNRKAKESQGHSLQSSPPAPGSALVQPSNSNYDRINIQPTSNSNYAARAVESPTQPSHYDALRPNEV